MPKKNKTGKMESPVYRNQRPSLTKETVLREAIRLADAEGLGALSMRTLGRRLGVEAMSLYNHVANKDEVLDGMVDLAVEEIDLPAPGEPWRQAMRARAISGMRAFKRHPWLSGLIDSRVSGGAGRLRYLESVLGTLRCAGFSPELTLHAFSLIDSYLYGFGRQSANIASSTSDTAESFLSALPSHEYPYLAEMAATYASGSAYDVEGDFEFGLDLILDGLHTLLETQERIDADD